jgi:hypothetical protein
MQSSATTVSEYLASLPEDRRAALETVRKVVLDNLDAGYREGIQYGHIGYFVPHERYPHGYHCDPRQPLPFAALGSQKNHMALYLMGVYCGCVGDGNGEGETAEAKWFRQAWLKTGKKLDMGKACVRFRKIDDVALDVVGEAIRRLPADRFVERYLESLRSIGKGPDGKKLKAVAPAKRTGAGKAAG